MKNLQDCCRAVVAGELLPRPFPLHEVLQLDGQRGWVGARQTRHITMPKPILKRAGFADIFDHMPTHDITHIGSRGKRPRCQLGSKVDAVENHSVTQIGKRGLRAIKELVNFQVIPPVAA